MTHKNDTMAAVMACESARTGNYGEDYYSQIEDEEDEICPFCKSLNPDTFYMDIDYSIVGCSDCIRQVEHLDGRN